MYDFSRQLGDVIRKGRLDAGLTQKEVSIILDMDYRTLLNFETYLGNPSMEKLYPLIKKAVVVGDLRGFSLCRSGSRIFIFFSPMIV